MDPAEVAKFFMVSDGEDDPVDNRQLHAALLTNDPALSEFNMFGVVTKWDRFLNTTFALGVRKVLQDYHPVIFGTSATHGEALVRANVYLEGYPGFERMTAFYDDVLDEVDAPGAASMSMTRRMVAPPVGPNAMDAMSAMLSHSAPVPSAFTRLVKDYLNAEYAIEHSLGGTAHNLLRSVCNDGTSPEGTMLAAMQRHLVLAGVPRNSRFIDLDFARKKPAYVYRVWLLMVNLPAKWYVHRESNKLVEWLSTSMAGYVAGRAALPFEALLHAGFTIHNVPSVEQLRTYFKVVASSMRPNSKNRSMINVHGMVFPPDGLRFSIVFDCVLGAYRTADPSLADLATRAGIPGRNSMAGTMNVILTSLMKKNTEKTDTNFARILHQYLIQHVKIPTDYPLFDDLYREDFALGASVDRLWRLFNVVLEFPDSFAVDNERTLRVAGRRARAQTDILTPSPTPMLIQPPQVQRQAIPPGADLQHTPLSKRQRRNESSEDTGGVRTPGNARASGPPAP